MWFRTHLVGLNDLILLVVIRQPLIIYLWLILVSWPSLRVAKLIWAVIWTFDPKAIIRSLKTRNRHSQHQAAEIAQELIMTLSGPRKKLHHITKPCYSVIPALISPDSRRLAEPAEAYLGVYFSIHFSGLLKFSCVNVCIKDINQYFIRKHQVLLNETCLF